MNENEKNSLETYNKKFEEDPSSFNDFQANDYIKLLKQDNNNDEAIEVGKTFMSVNPNQRSYINQYGYALYNKFINIEDEKIQANENIFYDIMDEILSLCKQERYSPVEPTINRAIKYLQNTQASNHAQMIKILEKLDPKLIDDKPFTNKEGKEFESKRERYYRILVKALYENKDYSKCLETANIALTLPLKWHYNTQQWIRYYRGCCLVELKQYSEAKTVFLSLQNRIRGVNFSQIVYRMEKNLGNDKVANAYLLQEFFEKGYSIENLKLYLELQEAINKTENDILKEIMDIFLTKLTSENNKSYTPLKDYGDKYNDKDSNELYDDLYDKVMNNLDKLVNRVSGSVVYYNKDKGIGTILDNQEERIFFRQNDYVYDEEVMKRDRVEYTPLETYDNKKDRLTTKAILIITTEEYVNYDY